MDHNYERKSIAKKKRRRASKLGRRLALIIAIMISVGIFFPGGFILGQGFTAVSASGNNSGSGSNGSSKPRAAIIDQLSLTIPNQTFIGKSTSLLKSAGYLVDYYSGENVTVDLYRRLPTLGYSLIILRVHSSASAFDAGKAIESPVILFTSEKYDVAKYGWEQLTGQLRRASFSYPPSPPFYFVVSPDFVTSSMRGNFTNTVIVMMGCEGLSNNLMAQAFIQKGAAAYIGWSEWVSADRTDQATTQLLTHLLIEKQPMNKAIASTVKEVGPDPTYNSTLSYYPLEAGEKTIKEILTPLGHKPE